MAKWQPVRYYRKCVGYECNRGVWSANLECGHLRVFKMKDHNGLLAINHIDTGYRPKRMMCQECVNLQVVAHQGLIAFARNQVRRYGKEALS